MDKLRFETEYYPLTIVGIDEVGRGAWAGPLVVGAVIINRQANCEGINDSKTLSKKKLQELNVRILNDHICAIGEASVEEIYDLNINGATTLAMSRAIAKLSKKPEIAFIDGNVGAGLNIRTLNIIKGDSLSISIAAASIIAKVYRDRLMAKLALDFPVYGWENNVGYGTKQHQLGLKLAGICKHHRAGYKPISHLVLANGLDINQV